MIVQIEKDGDDYIIPLTEELCKELGWEVGNNLNWEDNGDGSFTLSKAKSCWCYECNKDRTVSFGNLNIPFASTQMILCPKCGNKRCPHATDHNLECTNSNEPGQPGSRYA